MKQTYIIPACQGRAIEVKKGRKIAVIDLGGARWWIFLRKKPEIPGSLCPRG